MSIAVDWSGDSDGGLLKVWVGHRFESEAIPRDADDIAQAAKQITARFKAQGVADERLYEGILLALDSGAPGLLASVMRERDELIERCEFLEDDLEAAKDQIKDLEMRLEEGEGKRG